MSRRITRRKSTTTETAAEDNSGNKEKRSRNLGRLGKTLGNKKAGMGAGNSQSLDLGDLSEDYTFPKMQPLLWTRVTLPLPLPVDSNLRKCAVCSGILYPVTDTAGCPTSLLQCPRCPNAKLLCEQCLYPCSPFWDINTTTCTNQSCQIVSMLLNCDRVIDPKSNVYGCPQFRACPKCHSLMMHEKGCKYVRCSECKHSYCFICLQERKECTKAMDNYWSLNCSKPRADRQRFQT